MAPETLIAGGVFAVALLVQTIALIRWAVVQGHKNETNADRIAKLEKRADERDKKVDDRLTEFGEHLAELNGLLCGLGLDVRPALHRKRM